MAGPTLIVLSLTHSLTHTPDLSKQEAAIQKTEHSHHRCFSFCPKNKICAKSNSAPRRREAVIASSLVNCHG